MLDWLRAYTTAFWWLGALSIVTFVGTLIVIPILVARIPADYFTRDHHDAGHGHSKHPVLRLLGHILKNLFGIIFILAGLAMLLLPGQGIITILIGITVMDFPGKRALERRIVRQPAVLRAINWIRARVRQPALNVSQPASRPAEPQPDV